MKKLVLGVTVGLSMFGSAARAWELETHVGLTQRAVQHTGLDAWLRRHGQDAGLQEELDLRGEDGKLAPRDAALLGELSAVDAALGAVPDSGRQPALDWLLAGTALEGIGIEHIRNHFLDEHQHGLDERERLSSMRVRFVDVRAGLGTLRGAFTGVNFDGTGMAADRWVDAKSNSLSRPTLVAAQLEAVRAPTPRLRAAALARALVATGAVLHVLEAVGDPANARNDFYTSVLVAHSPLERYAAERYGMLVPSALGKGPPRETLAAFFHASDGTGLTDEVRRAYLSPATQATRPTTADLAATADTLLARIGAESAALLDFLFRGTLELEQTEGVVVVRAGLGLGAGTFELYLDDADGRRSLVRKREVASIAAGGELTRFEHLDAARAVVVFSGVDAAGEPVVVVGSGAK